MMDQDGFGPDDILASGDVSRETIERLEVVIACLHEWREKINLIGPAEAGRIWRRHVLDCVQLLPYVDLSKTVLDLGSGAGFPGLVMAAAAVESGGTVIMVESVGKKCAFLREAIARADLPAKVLNQRVETTQVDDVSTVTARAFAPLPKLLDYASPWLENGAIGVFPKGRRWEEELTEAADCWTFAHEVIPSRTGDGVILKIQEIARGV